MISETLAMTVDSSYTKFLVIEKYAILGTMAFWWHAVGKRAYSRGAMLVDVCEPPQQG